MNRLVLILIVILGCSCNTETDNLVRQFSNMSKFKIITEAESVPKRIFKNYLTITRKGIVITNDPMFTSGDGCTYLRKNNSWYIINPESGKDLVFSTDKSTFYWYDYRVEKALRNKYAQLVELTKKEIHGCIELYKLKVYSGAQKSPDYHYVWFSPIYGIVGNERIGGINTVFIQSIHKHDRIEEYVRVYPCE